jgi:hypothetical protein
MGSEILLPDSQDETWTSMLEVEFALVLSRMIDSVQNDPEHLRETIYELARHKMREQAISQSLAERGQLSKALETAIQGVEMFVKKDEMKLGALPIPEPAQRQPRNLPGPPRTGLVQPEAPFIEVEGSNRARKRSMFRLAAPVRFGIVVAIALMIVLAITERETPRIAAGPVAALLAQITPKLAQSTSPTPIAPTVNTSQVPEPSPTTPTTYGIYAVSGDKLYELELLPGRAPDIRVAVSAAIRTPSRTVLPDGHLKFIVYRRDSATDAADHAEVRILAKVERETGFDRAGKPVQSKIDDTWVIRNISIPFRTAPKKDNADMYEVQTESPESNLSPGRYALVLRNQAYDFSIAGPISDPKQCLERLAANNGQFYSGCQKP